MIANSLIFIFSILFSINLTDIEINDYDNCVFVIVNDLYCKDCLDEISKSQSIWNKEFKTIIVRKSPKNAKSVFSSSEMIKSKIKFDEIIFVESKKKEFNKPIIFLNQEFSETPILFIRKNKQDYLISFNYLFGDKNYSNVKNKILDSLKSIMMKSN